MKKILILANSSGGLYDFRNELVLELLKQHQVIASLPDTVRTKELEAEGCRIVHTGINRRGMNPIEDLKLLRAYYGLISKEKPDLVLTYTIKPNIYGGICCRWTKTPYLVTVTGLGSTFQKAGLLRRVITLLYRMGLKRSACVFFQNEENRQIFESFGIRGKKSRLVSGSGVNLQRHCQEPYPDTEKVQFLYVGRLMREKGTQELLDAARELHSEKIEFAVLGYCDEDYQEQLNVDEQAGYIRQLGFHPDVHEYIKNCSAVVLPSYHEGMSNVLMEGSATGRPVIATRISGCKEIFEEGITGFGCDPQNSEDLIRALKEFLKLSVKERGEMGQKAREKMEREFDRQKIVKNYMEEIQDGFIRKTVKR